MIIDLLFSCSSSSDKIHKSDSLLNANKVNSFDAINQQLKRQSLIGKIFLFAPEFDKTTCSTKSACDCCSYNILFTTDSKFLLIDYCESNSSYNKGFYSFDSSSLTLKIDRLMVSKIYNFDKEVNSTDEIKNEYSYKVENIKPVTTIVKHQNCNGDIVFKVDNDFGTEDRIRSFTKEIKKIKDDGVWKKLELQ